MVTFTCVDAAETRGHLRKGLQTCSGVHVVKSHWPNWENGTELLKDKAFKHELPSVVRVLISYVMAR